MEPTSDEAFGPELISSLVGAGGGSGPGAGGASVGAPMGPYSDAVGTYVGERVDDGLSRALGQADLVQVDANRLYALSRYRGLSIIDISSRARLTLLGEHVTEATPFEMYVEGAVVYLMFDGWPSYVCDSTSACKWVTESRIQALDVRDPAHVQLVAEQTLPGALVAGRERLCGAIPSTSVTTMLPS